MWFAREVISLAPCQFNILFLEKKKKKERENLRKDQLLCMERYALKKKKTIKAKTPLCSFPKAFCLGLQELETLSSIWLPMGSLVCRGEPHLFWITAGTVGQSSPSDGAWNNGSFLSSAHPRLLTQP